MLDTLADPEAHGEQIRRKPGSKKSTKTTTFVPLLSRPRIACLGVDP